jgi:hypothetical protein
MRRWMLWIVLFAWLTPGAAAAAGAAADGAPVAAEAEGTAPKPRVKPSSRAARPKRARAAPQEPYELVQVPPEGQGPTDPEEQFRLGQALMLGHDTNGRQHREARKPVEGVVWLRKAAEQGHPRAQASLGVAYLRGRGVEQDYGIALEWLDRAAVQGSGKAMLELGLLYREGQGVPLDRIRAAMWLMLAGQQGSTAAAFVISGVVRKLSAEEREQALRMAREWREEHDYPTLHPAAGRGQPEAAGDARSGGPVEAPAAERSPGPGSSS